MAFNFKYYGKTNPEEDPDARPLGEWTWDKLPMDQAPHIDWKTGTVRSPLFNASKPAEIPKAPDLDIPDFGDAGGSLPAGKNDGQILYWDNSGNWHLADTEPQTVVTGVRYDTTTHQIQVKTRQVRVIVVPDQAESNWAIVVGGQAETYP